MGIDIHKATFNGHNGWYNPKTGRVKFNNRIFPCIEVAVKYLKNK